MKASYKQYAKALIELVKENEEEAKIKEIVNNFFNILVKNNQLSQIEKILIYFNNYWNKENNIIEAELVSAYNIEEEVIIKLSEFIKEQTKASEINLLQKKDKKILGGFILRFDGTMIDSSIKDRLRQLKNNLTN